MSVHSWKSLLWMCIWDNIVEKDCYLISVKTESFQINLNSLWDQSLLKDQFIKH